MKRNPFFWIGALALASLVSIGTDPLSAQTRSAAETKTAKPPAATASKTPAKSSTRYSAARARNRRAALARARAAAYAREVGESLPRLKTDESGVLVPDVRAEAAIVYDPETNQVLWEQNSQTQRSIASITKVMTAVVFLEDNPELSTPVTVARSDVFRASTTFLRANDKLTVDDLLHLLLIASDNAAARALARVSPLGTEGFINRMNEKAAELELTSTHYEDTSGLLSDNVSSAFDMARLITYASSDERIGSIMRTSEYSLRTANVRPRPISFRSTNHLLGRQDVEVRAGKTGFISKAGYCLATLLRLPHSGSQVAVVVLGARSNAGRFVETRNLFDWLSTKTQTLFSAAASPVPPVAPAQAAAQ
ncbi:MAG TPA: serine hydrolase [Vicinamibacterales bacterium]|nr:serine hydrolase [Vicinamibacterales bacterium]